jgi:hypothetical protein
MLAIYWWVLSSTCSLNWITPKWNGNTVARSYTLKRILQGSKKPTMFKDLKFTDGSTHQFAAWIEQFPSVMGTLLRSVTLWNTVFKVQRNLQCLKSKKTLLNLQFELNSSQV